MDEAKRVARAIVEDEPTESSGADSDADSTSFDVERFLRTLAGQDTAQSRERRTGKQLVAVSLVALGVLRRLSRDERIGRLLAETDAPAQDAEAEPAAGESSGSRSVVGTLLRLLTFAVVVAVVAYAVQKRRAVGDSEPDATERDITETNVAEEDVMGTNVAEEDEVDEMVDTVEDESGDVSPEPGETVVEEDVVEAATDEDGDQTAGEAVLETEESDDETDEEESDGSDTESDSGGTEGESPLEADGEAESDDEEAEETSESPNQ